MSAATDPATTLKPGSALKEVGGEGRGRLSGFAMDSTGQVFGLTTNLIFGGDQRKMITETGAILTALDDAPTGTEATSIGSTLTRLLLEPSFRLISPAKHELKSPQFLDPFAAVGTRVKTLRYPPLLTFGEVIGAGFAARLRNARTGTDRVHVDLLVIKPDLDGALFGPRGDAGALLMSTDDKVIGVLIGKGEDTYYAAPLDDFLQRHALRFVTEAKLVQITKFVTRKTPMQQRLDAVASQFAQITPDLSKADVERIGRKIGEEIAAEQRTLEATELKEAGLHHLWRYFAVSDCKDSAEQRRANNQRACRIQILRSWRERIIDILPPQPDFRLPYFKECLHLEDGSWGYCLALIDEIRGEFDTVRRFQPNAYDRIVITRSDYHEERILADIVTMLDFSRSGRQVFETAHSPWRFGRKLGETRKQLNQDQGGADVRLVNVVAGKANNRELLRLDRPIFQHYGYTAYCRKGWLRGISMRGNPPPRVRGWIDRALQDAGDLLTPDSLEVRAWLLASGKPVNYQDTEFPPLFEYIWDLGRRVGTLGEYPKFSEKDPDQIFQEFTSRSGRVFMNGSIYDLILDEWLSEGDDIITLLDASDFHGLRLKTYGDLGKNALLFSPRISDRPQLADMIVRLYNGIWTTLLSQLEESAVDAGAYRYLASLLAPDPNKPKAWSFATSNDAIKRLMTVEVRPVPNNVILINRQATA